MELTAFKFDPPSNQKDFKDPSSYEKWNQQVSDWMDTSIQGNNDTRPLGISDPNSVRLITNPQFFNQLKTPPVGDTAVKTVSWNGFPKSLKTKYPQGLQRFIAAETLQQTQGGLYRQLQDEYLEWFTYHDSKKKYYKN